MSWFAFAEKAWPPTGSERVVLEDVPAKEPHDPTWPATTNHAAFLDSVLTQSMEVTSDTPSF